MNGSNKVVLAFSGGLDTSVILKWLVDKGYEVITYTADVGQNDVMEAIKEKALNLGASKAYVVDLKKAFVEEYIFTALKADAVYEKKYLLGTAIARPLIAKAQVDIAIKEGTNKLAHGCTGKGNDQVRFELTWMKFMPDVEIISPWKQKEFLSQFKGRKDLIAYAKKNNISITATLEKPYSIDENLMHTSYESGILEDITKSPSPSIFKGFTFPTEAPKEGEEIIITFEKGIPISVQNLSTGEAVEGSLELFVYLNKLGAKHGIGLVDMVENRVIGIKSRGIYIAPAATILWEAHRDLESITLDKKVFHLKLMFSELIGDLIYAGLWYSPEMEFLMKAIEHSQEHVNGKVHILLYKGNVIIKGRESENSLYSSTLASMDESSSISPQDAKGFINVVGLKYKLGSKPIEVVKEYEALE